MRIASYSALLVGLAIVTVLVAWRGFGTIAAALATLGAGVLLLPAVYAFHIAGAAASWSLLFPPGRRPPYRALLRAIWIGLSVDAVLPGTGIGTEAAKARLLMLSGVRGNDAVSSVVVDLTVQGMALAVWAMAAVAALAVMQAGATLLWSALTGSAVIALAIAGFLLAQRAGLFGFLARAGARTVRAKRWQGLVDSAELLDGTVRAVYGRARRVLLACLVRCLSRGLLVLEVWLAAAMIGHPITASGAVILIGIIGALRAAAFVVPGAWGIQEGGYVVLGALIGLPPEIALAVSLATRVREVLVGLPALIVWQRAEGRTLRGLLRQRIG